MRELLQWTKILWANFPVQTEMFTEHLGVYMKVGVCVFVRVREHVFMCVRAWTVVGSMHMLNDLIDISPYCLVTFYNAWDAMQNAELQLWAVDTFVSVSAKHLRKICHRNA